MAKISPFDGRLMHLGEASDLLEYAKEIQTLLKLRWKQQEIAIAARCQDAGYSQEDFDSEYQFEEYQHTKYELYLDGQLVITAWSLLQGAVGHCAAFLAEHLNVQTKLSSLKAHRRPVEVIWQDYYENYLRTDWPLKNDHLEISRLRLLRNDYGHSLFFEPFSARARLAKINLDKSPEESDLLYRIDEFAALQGQGLPACELASRLVDKMKTHAATLLPHDGVSFSLWNRAD